MDWGISMPDHELQEWMTLIQSVSEPDRIRHVPPPGLFDLIAAEIADDPIDHAGSIAARTFPEPEPAPERVGDLPKERNRRAPSAQRQHRRRLLLASIAAACAFVAGFVLLRGDDTTVTFVAETTNSTMPEAFDGTATATLTSGDRWTLSIDLSESLPEGEPVEIWAIKPDLSDMVSLGIIEPGTSEFDWPAGFPPTEYSLIDLSIEPDDGNPAHSGRSILRGELRSV